MRGIEVNRYKRKTPQGAGLGGVIAQSETGFANVIGGPEGTPSQTVYTAAATSRSTSGRRILHLFSVLAKFYEEQRPLSSDNWRLISFDTPPACRGGLKAHRLAAASSDDYRSTILGLV